MAGFARCAFVPISDIKSSENEELHFWDQGGRRWPDSHPRVFGNYGAVQSRHAPKIAEWVPLGDAGDEDGDGRETWEYRCLKIFALIGGSTGRRPMGANYT